MRIGYINMGAVRQGLGILEEVANYLFDMTSCKVN
jgi:hypothetical protein